jgi:hypothetical protein
MDVLMLTRKLMTVVVFQATQIYKPKYLQARKTMIKPWPVCLDAVMALGISIVFLIQASIYPGQGCKFRGKKF